MLLFWEKHLIDHLEYDVLHRWEVESLHCKFCAILNVYPEMYIIFVIILDSKHQTEISSLLLAIISHHMNQIVEYLGVELFDILDDEDYRSEFVNWAIVI